MLWIYDLYHNTTAAYNVMYKVTSELIQKEMIYHCVHNKDNKCVWLHVLVALDLDNIPLLKAHLHGSNLRALECAIS